MKEVLEQKGRLQEKGRQKEKYCKKIKDDISRIEKEELTQSNAKLD